jgi:hypothetical protein
MKGKGHAHRRDLHRLIDERDMLQASETKILIDEITKIKKDYIKKHGTPKPVTDINLKGIIYTGKPRKR